MRSWIRPGGKQPSCRKGQGERVRRIRTYLYGCINPQVLLNVIFGFTFPQLIYILYVFFPCFSGTAARMDAPLHQSPSWPSCKNGDSLDATPLGERQRWCGVDSAMMTWLGVKSVQKALNVRSDKKASEGNNLAYTKAGADDLTALYKRIAEKYVRRRIYIYISFRGSMGALRSPCVCVCVKEGGGRSGSGPGAGWRYSLHKFVVTSFANYPRVNGST